MLFLAVLLPGALWAQDADVSPVDGLVPGEVTADGEDALYLSLEDALNRVDAQNLTVLINRTAVEQALYVLKQRRAALYPQVDLNVSQGRSKTAVPGQSGQTRSRFSAGLDATVEIFDANTHANIKLARLGYDIAELDAEDVRQDIYAAVANAYITHLRNLGRMMVIEADIERALVLLDLARNQFNAGVATQIDVTRAEVQVSQNERDRLQQETAILQSEMNLKRLLDLDLDRNLRLDDLMDRIDEPRLTGYEFMRVLDDRADYQEALQQLDQAELARRAVQLQRLPNVSAYGSYGWADSEPFAGNDGETWSIGLRLNMPIFEGFRIKNERLQASSFVRARELALQDIENTIGADLRVALQDLRSRYDQILVSEQEVSLSRQELDLARSRFQQGVADNREIIDAQNRVAQAEDALIEARYQYGLARIRLAHITGDVTDILDS
ncbi:MAG: TolC family protein [Verrucomicrobiota bacterium]